MDKYISNISLLDGVEADRPCCQFEVAISLIFDDRDIV